MIQKFGGIITPAYQYTESFEDLPEKLLTNIKTLAVDWKKESFVASCWIHNFLSSAKIFVLVTNQRVVFTDTIRVRQNLFADMTGVERNKLNDNITLLSPGNPNQLFPSGAKPETKLLTLLFNVINSTWIKTRQGNSAGANGAAAGTNTDPSSVIMQQIEKLGELKAKGILSDEEFQQKKTELLAKL